MQHRTIIINNCILILFLVFYKLSRLFFGLYTLSCLLAKFQLVSKKNLLRMVKLARGMLLAIPVRPGSLKSQNLIRLTAISMETGISRGVRGPYQKPFHRG